MAITVIDEIVIKNDASRYVIDVSRVKGAWQGVADSVERDAIPAANRKSGMIVEYPDSTRYKLAGDLTTWNLVSSSGFIPTSEKGAVNGVAPLNASQKIDSSYLPNLFLNTAIGVDDIAEMLALTTVTGTMVIVADATGDPSVLSGSATYYKINNDDPADLVDFLKLEFGNSVISVNGDAGVVTVSITSLLGEGTNATDLNTFITSSDYAGITDAALSALETTTDDLETRVSTLESDVADYLSTGDNVSELVNDAGYITAAEVGISDEAYNESTWNAVVDAAPSKNAVRDIIETVLTNKADKTVTDAGNIAGIDLGATGSPYAVLYATDGVGTSEIDLSESRSRMRFIGEFNVSNIDILDDSVELKYDTAGDNVTLILNTDGVTSNSKITSPSLLLSGETASTIASFDATKNVKSLSLATYPSLTELSYVKGVSSGIQSQFTAIGSGKQDTLVSGTNIKTINGSSLLGAGDLSVSVSAAGLASTINSATSKATPVDADEFGLTDSAASYGLKKLTWANLKATLKTYTDTLYPSGSGTSSGTNTGDNATNTTSNSYADAKVADAINDGTTTVAPSQNAVFDALALKAPLASPSLTGTPLSTTAANGTNTTQIATTAFVQSNILLKGLTGFTSGAGTVSASDTLLSSIQKLDGNIEAKLNLSGGTLTGDLTISKNAPQAIYNITDLTASRVVGQTIQNNGSGRFRNVLTTGQIFQQQYSLDGSSWSVAESIDVTALSKKFFVPLTVDLGAMSNDTYEAVLTGTHSGQSASIKLQRGGASTRAGWGFYGSSSGVENLALTVDYVGRVLINDAVGTGSGFLLTSSIGAVSRINVSPLLAAPTATEQGWAITWDNTQTRYRLTDLTTIGLVSSLGNNLGVDANSFSDITDAAANNGNIKYFSHTTGSSNYPTVSGNVYTFTGGTAGRTFSIHKDANSVGNLSFRDYSSTTTANAWRTFAFQDWVTASYAPIASPTFTGTVTIPTGAVLNTPLSATLTNATGLPVTTGISGLGSGVATWLSTPSWTNFGSAITGTAPYWGLTGTSTLTGDVTIAGNFNKFVTGTNSFVIGDTSVASTNRFKVKGISNASASLALFVDSDDVIRFRVLDNGTTSIGGSLNPTTTATYDIGQSGGTRWANVYVSNSVDVAKDGNCIQLGNSFKLNLAFTGGGSNKTQTFTNANGTIATQEWASANFSASTPSSVSTVSTSTVLTITGINQIVRGNLSSDITTFLPTAAGNSGYIIHFKRVDATAFTWTIDANTTETIDGELDVIVSGQWTMFSIYSNGTNWEILN